MGKEFNEYKFNWRKLVFNIIAIVTLAVLGVIFLEQWRNTKSTIVVVNIVLFITFGIVVPSILLMSERDDWLMDDLRVNLNKDYFRRWKWRLIRSYRWTKKFVKKNWTYILEFGIFCVIVLIWENGIKFLFGFYVAQSMIRRKRGELFDKRIKDLEEIVNY